MNCAENMKEMMLAEDKTFLCDNQDGTFNSDFLLNLSLASEA